MFQQDNFNFLSSDELSDFLEAEAKEKKLDLNINVDNSGNVIVCNQSFLKSNKPKILITAPVMPVDFYVTKIDKHKAFFKCTQSVKPESYIDLYVVSENGISGILKKDNNDIYIEIMSEKTVENGERFRLRSNHSRKANKLYGVNPTQKISLNIAKEFINSTFATDKSICFTLYCSEMHIKTLIKKGCFDYIINLMYSEVSEDFKLSKGCGIAYKDGGTILSDPMLHICEKSSFGIAHQAYIKSGKSLSDFISSSNTEAQKIALYIPVKNIRGKCEASDMSDIEGTLKITENLIKEMR